MLQLSGVSFLWLLFSLLLGAGYAFALYNGTNSISRAARAWLFTFRLLVVAAICFLLFAPFVKQTERIAEKPLIIFAQDNSASLNVSKPVNFNLADYSAKVKALQSRFAAAYEVRSFTLGSQLKPGSSFHFNENTTDINSFFRFINDRFANRNIGAVILASDGIYNRGGNPQYEAKALKAPVFTIALGDTIPRKDLLVANVNYNSIVWSGNDFQAEVSIEAHRSAGMRSRLTVSGKDGRVLEKEIEIRSNEYHVTVPVTLHAGKAGIHRFTVALSPLQGELSVENNREDFFVEVLDGKLKVFILASSPHPDIAALKQAIESNKNYEVKTGLASGADDPGMKDAALLILHQLPSASVSMQSLSGTTRGKAVLFVTGAQSNITALSQSQNLLEITSGGSMLEATAGVNGDFHTFMLQDGLAMQLSALGPLVSPAGSYRIKSPASVFLYQQLGSILSDRPLLLFSNTSEQKIGILAGEGIWRWRLNEFRLKGNHEATDALLTKSVQYLSEKDDKRKFRVYPARNSFDENDHVLLNAELYNDANELVNTPDVSVVLTGEGNRKLPFQFSRTSNAYALDAGSLPSGEYSFDAVTQLGERKYKAGGRFIVSRQHVEFRQTIANHQLLNVLAKQSGGEMLMPGDMDELYDRVQKNEMVKTISYENRTFEEMIDMKWIFVMIILLLSAEWSVRKRSGAL